MIITSFLHNHTYTRSIEHFHVGSMWEVRQFFFSVGFIFQEIWLLLTPDVLWNSLKNQPVLSHTISFTLRFWKSDQLIIISLTTRWPKAHFKRHTTAVQNSSDGVAHVLYNKIPTWLWQDFSIVWFGYLYLQNWDKGILKNLQVLFWRPRSHISNMGY